jgi:hypothetical protein
LLLLPQACCLRWPTHFWPALTVAREIGLSHLSVLTRRGRRIVSEDSRCRIAPLSASVHAFPELENGDVVGIAQDTLRQKRDRAPEESIVLCLPPDKRESIEERNDATGNVQEAVYLPVPAPVAGLTNRSAAEGLVKEVERSSILLRDVEGGRDLPLPPVVASSTTYEHEAGLAQSETRQEAPERARDRFHSEPFLLIVRTRHVVTIVNARSDVTMSSAGCSEFPAYSRLLQLPWSIVTAAVYRGLASRLRPKANLSA